jgi:ATP-dependent Clp protease ATP-binding subunit ClpA
MLAQQVAARLGHRSVGPEHLLLALLHLEDDLAPGILREAGLTVAAVEQEIRHGLDAGSVTQASDVDALRAIGIDLDAIRTRVEASFGPGALEAGSRRPGVRPFTRPAKKLLERSLREAVARKHRHVGTEHLLLAMMHDPQGVTARIVVRLGLSPDHLRQTVLRAVHEAA